MSYLNTTGGDSNEGTNDKSTTQNEEDEEIKTMKAFIAKYKLHNLQQAIFEEAVTLKFLLQEDQASLELIAKDLSPKHTQQRKFLFGINELKKQNPEEEKKEFNDIPTATISNVVSNGLIAWFEATDKRTLSRTKWCSKVNNYVLTPCSVARQRNLTAYNQNAITLRQSANLQTIVHSFENETGSKHADVHGAKGFLSNFYILTSTSTYHFHGGLDNIGVQATLRLNGKDERSAAGIRRWEGGEHKIAILELNEKGKNMNINRIGADRSCHHYCGTVIELLIYDRKLNKDEKITMEKYLMKKYLNQ